MADLRELMAVALEAGHYSVVVDGARHWAVADCPAHQTKSPVSMPIKEGRRIVALVFRCPVDGETFRLKPDQAYVD